MRVLISYEGGSTYYDSSDVEGVTNFVAHLIQCKKEFKVEYLVY